MVEQIEEWDSVDTAVVGMAARMRQLGADAVERLVLLLARDQLLPLLKALNPMSGNRQSASALQRQPSGPGTPGRALPSAQEAELTNAIRRLSALCHSLLAAMPSLSHPQALPCVRPLALALYQPLVACAFAGVAAEQMPQDPANIIQPTDPAADPAATDAAASADEEKPLATVAAVLSENDLEFATLLAAVEAAEQGVVASDLKGAGPFTVFAPNNEAFKKFFKDSDYTPKKLLADPELGDILRRHVIAGEVTAADALAMDLPVEVPTLDGESAIKIDKTVDGELLVAGNKVVSPDLKASNGVVHGIDGVIVDVAPAGAEDEGAEDPEN